MIEATEKRRRDRLFGRFLQVCGIAIAVLPFVLAFIHDRQNPPRPYDSSRIRAVGLDPYDPDLTGKVYELDPDLFDWVTEGRFDNDDDAAVGKLICFSPFIVFLGVFVWAWGTGTRAAGAHPRTSSNAPS